MTFILKLVPSGKFITVAPNDEFAIVEQYPFVFTGDCEETIAAIKQEVADGYFPGWSEIELVATEII